MSTLTQKLVHSAEIIKERHYNPLKITEIHVDTLTKIFLETEMTYNGCDEKKRTHELKYKLRPFVWIEGFAVESRYGRVDWIVIINLRDWIIKHTRNELTQDRLFFDKNLVEEMFSYIPELTDAEKFLLEDYVDAREAQMRAEEDVKKKKLRLVQSLESKQIG